MADDKNEPKTHVITEHRDRPAVAPDTDDVGTYVAGIANARAIGRMVIVDGAAAGQTRPFYDGTNSIGRDPDQNRVPLDVEDTHVSRSGHAILAVDHTRGRMTILDGGKPNRVLLNGSGFEGERVIGPNDLVQIGRTTVRFEFS